eukprot:COSAG04_NODE_84_length_27625_cov_23.289835_9_plen_923_part_00
MELRRLGIAIAALLLWLPASSEAACSDHNGKGCGACAGQDGGLLGKCGWCGIDQKCAACKGIECKLATKCAAAQMITDAKQCPAPRPAWTPPKSAMIAGCPYENLTCQHGTRMNQSYCQEIVMLTWPNCNKNNATMHACLPTPANPWPKYRWCYAPASQMHATCECPDYLNGTDCALVMPRQALPKSRASLDPCGPTAAGHGHPAGSLAWDGSFINTKLQAPKHLECFLDPTKTPFTLTDQRVNITITPSSTAGLRDIEIQITQRRRGDHTDAESPALLDAMKQCLDSPLNPIPGGGGNAVCLFPRQSDITCVVSDCGHKYVPGDAAGVWDAQYTCASAKCAAWAGLEASAKAILNQINGQNGGIQFVFKSVNETLGTARTAFETNEIIFDMACRTGQCIPHNQSAIPKPKHHPHRAISGWAIAAIVVLAAVAALGVALAIGMRAQRRPATAAKDGGRELEASNPGVALAFQRVSYDVPKPGGGERRVLQGATGLVRPGELCAIMGPSGAGKSSCLDILAGQDKRGTVGGRAYFVLPDGRTVPAAESRRHLCRYVMQDDRAMATETVEEALTFAARMALPNSVPVDQIPAAVDDVVRKLGLEGVRESRIGSSDAGGLSGGERRRLAVGVELIARPSVLLADEPTSGLDSVSADIVMRALAETARDGCAVVLTIHQPSSQVFSLFDKLCLLSPGGGQAFFGAPADARAIALGWRTRLQDDEATVEALRLNPAEEILQYAVDGAAEAVEAFSTSDARAAVEASVSQALAGLASPQPSQARGSVELVQDGGTAVALPPPSEAPDAADLPGALAQFELLCRRGFRHVFRDSSLMFLQLGVTLLVAVITGLLFLHPGLDLTGVHNRTGLLFFVVIYFSLISMSSIGAIVADKETFVRERSAGMYSTEPYAPPPPPPPPPRPLPPHPP